MTGLSRYVSHRLSVSSSVFPLGPLASPLPAPQLSLRPPRARLPLPPAGGLRPPRVPHPSTPTSDQHALPGEALCCQKGAPALGSGCTRRSIGPHTFSTGDRQWHLIYGKSLIYSNGRKSALKGTIRMMEYSSSPYILPMGKLRPWGLECLTTRAERTAHLILHPLLFPLSHSQAPPCTPKRNYFSLYNL